MPDSSRTQKRRFAQDEMPPEVQNDWLQRLARFNLRFGRFVRDAIGVLLIAFALMSLFAVLGFSNEQSYLFLFANTLSVWFGWGSVFVIFGIGYFGYYLLQRNADEIRWTRLIGLELASLLTLGLLALLISNDLLQAESGMGGGRLGWGLVTLAWKLGVVGGSFLLFMLWGLAVMTGFGLWARLETWLLHFAGEAPPVVIATPVPEQMEQKLEEEPSKVVVAPKKKAPPIPPEFRTSLKAADKKEEKSVKAPPRGEDLPSLQVLLADTAVRADERTINQTAGLIMKTLAEFGIPATVIGYRVGPAVTQFVVQPGFIKKPGTAEEDAQQMKVRVAQIASLEKDIALALSAQRLRIEAPVPGKPYVGIEVPNTQSTIVRMRTLLESEAFYKVGSCRNFTLGFFKLDKDRFFPHLPPVRP